MAEQLIRQQVRAEYYENNAEHLKTLHNCIREWTKAEKAVEGTLAMGSDQERASEKKALSELLVSRGGVKLKNAQPKSPFHFHC